jgi:Bacterial regulatory helix-turn-helix protein, lysR family
MLVRHLSYFVTLARERHFARAAEACNVAQPTLSAAIRKLEEDLEARLVIRSHHFVGLTPEGERVLAWLCNRHSLPNPVGRPSRVRCRRLATSFRCEPC